jgi:hypothetical protein
MREKEIEGIIIEKYTKEDYIFPSFYNNLFLQEISSLSIMPPTKIELVCYKIKSISDNNLYELVTDKSCDLPIGARINLKETGRLFKELIVVLERKKYSIISLNKVTSKELKN